MRYCSACSSDSRVLDTRAHHTLAHAWRRRRECISCGARWTTAEIRGDVLAELMLLKEDMERANTRLQALGIVRNGKNNPHRTPRDTEPSDPYRKREAV